MNVFSLTVRQKKLAGGFKDDENFLTEKSYETQSKIKRRSRNSFVHAFSPVNMKFKLLIGTFKKFRVYKIVFKIVCIIRITLI